MPFRCKLFRISYLFIPVVYLVSLASLQAQTWGPHMNQPPSPDQSFPVSANYYPFGGYQQPYAPMPGYYPYPAQNQPVQAPLAQNDQRKKPKSKVQSRKANFVKQLLPIIQQENERLLALRHQVLQLLILLNRGYQLKQYDADWLNALGKKYQVKGDLLKESSSRAVLLNKVDIIPASLALAQAANESAWGQSRFTREANNIFGIWTYDSSKGVTPKRREQDKKHLIRKFKHIGESIQFYMHILNSHPAYRKLRKIRQELRDKNSVINGEALASGLEKYSAKGTRYVSLIQKLIRQNDWQQLDRKV